VSLVAFPNRALRSAATTAAPALTSCGCCGGTRHEPIATRRGLPLRRCRDCGVVFVFPIPAQRAASPAGAVKNIPPDSALVMDNMLIRHGVASGRFLEIGCTEVAATLASMKRLNWDVTAAGIDQSPDLFQITNFADNSFDVIYLGGGVIGHVASPRQLLAETRRILRPRGLLVLRAPNARSGFATLTLAAARVMHGAWIASQAPQQLHEFTRKSLRILLESVGYQIAWNRAEARSGLLAQPVFGGMLERLALAPAHLVGAALDLLSRGGSEIFLGARKPQQQHGALTS